MNTNNSVLLIADSGGTKTLWTLADTNGNPLCTLKAEGINPLLLNDEDVVRKMQPALQMLQQQFDSNSATPSISLNFYGSGVTRLQESRMQTLLHQCFAPLACLDNIHAHSDMLGAARALAQHRDGIVCILGTGSNSCHYDGLAIVEQTPSLGYILGDEGGAVYMGKMLLNTIYKGLCDSSIKRAFEYETGENLQSIIDKVYRQPMPNTFIASLAHFIHNHIDEYAVLSDIVKNSFKTFIRHNILPYHCSTLPVHALGGIAWVFQKQWREALHDASLQPGSIAQSPVEGLLRFHSQHSPTPLPEK